MKKPKGIVNSWPQEMADKFWPLVLLGFIIVWPPLLRTCYRAIKADRETRNDR